MGRFVKGDIVVLNFPFSDLSGAKRRPALVVSDLDGDDIILCQITSRSKTDKYSIKIETNDFISGKLLVESVIRPNKIFTADQNLILYTACKINNEKTNEVIKTIADIVIEAKKFQIGVRSLVIYNRKVLLLKRSGGEHWESPGGRVEFGEDLHSALRREIKEETGLNDINIGNLLYALTFISAGKHDVGLMYISYANSDKIVLSNEHEDFVWADREKMNLLSKGMIKELNENSVYLDLLDID